MDGGNVLFLDGWGRKWGNSTGRKQKAVILRIGVSKQQETPTMRGFLGRRRGWGGIMFLQSQQGGKRPTLTLRVLRITNEPTERQGKRENKVERPEKLLH